MDVVTGRVRESGEKRTVKIEGASPPPERITLTNGNGTKTSSSAVVGGVSSGSIKTSVLTHTSSASAAAASSPLTHKSRTSSNKTASKSPRPPKSVAESVLPTKEEQHATSHSSSFDSITSELDFASEFGVQELSVFAVKNSKTAQESVAMAPNRPETVKTVPTAATRTTQVLSHSAPPPPSTSSLLASPNTLQFSSHSVFKPLSLSISPVATCPSPSVPSATTTTPYRPKTPTCTSSQLTSLLTSPISAHPPSSPATTATHPTLTSTSTSVLPPSNTATLTPASPATQDSATSKQTALAGKDTSANSSKQLSPAVSSKSALTSQHAATSSPKPHVTQLSRLDLVPKVASDSIFAETASSLPPVQNQAPTTVQLKDFTEAFVHGDTTNWFQRMLLLDHIDSVQEKVADWMEQMERELDGIHTCTCNNK